MEAIGVAFSAAPAAAGWEGAALQSVTKLPNRYGEWNKIVVLAPQARQFVARHVSVGIRVEENASPVRDGTSFVTVWEAAPFLFGFLFGGRRPGRVQVHVVDERSVFLLDGAAF